MQDNNDLVEKLTLKGYSLKTSKTYSATNYRFIQSLDLKGSEIEKMRIIEIIKFIFDKENNSISYFNIDKIEFADTIKRNYFLNKYLFKNEEFFKAPHKIIEKNNFIFILSVDKQADAKKLKQFVSDFDKA